MKKSIATILIAGLAFTLLSLDMPKNWFATGEHVKDYEMGIEKGGAPAGANAATIKSVVAKASGFGTLMQSCSPKKYLGKKLRMTGMLKTENVKGWAGLWMRVDGERGKQPLAFDNMQDRAVRNSTGWKEYSVTLDVPDNATNLAYGSLLVGAGQVWFSNIRFEVVGNADGQDMHNDLSTRMPLSEPDNLDFKE